jgi:hypothetical protein
MVEKNNITYKMLRVTHNAGFFSCFSVRAHEIIQYFNINKCLPSIVDSSVQFRMYKHHFEDDITFDFLKPYNNDIEIHYTGGITLDITWLQFQKYKDIPYNTITPFINKYFTPSDRIQSLSTSIMEKYALTPTNCIGVYYRGTDKHRETSLASYSSFYTKLKEVLAIPGNEHAQILIQSDTQQFLEYIKAHSTDISANIIIITENTISNTSRGIHNEHTYAENYIDIQNFFATLLILAKCKHFICSSGNCSIWAVYFRENAHNVHQVLNNIWI